MVLNFKKIGLILLAGSIVFIIALKLWPEAKLEKEIPIRHDNLAGESSLLTESELPATDDFFAEYRLERERVHSRQIELLREILNSTAAEEARKEASLRLVKISENMENELQAEGMVKSKGFHECVVIIQEKIALVVVPENIRVDQEEEISEAIEKVTGHGKDNITIISHKTR